MKIKQILKDPKHWLGWGITTAAVVLIINFMIFMPKLEVIFALFAAIVLVDLFKHKVKLQ